MKKKYVTVDLELLEFKKDVILASVFADDNFIDGDGDSIGGIGEL